MANLALDSVAFSPAQLTRNIRRIGDAQKNFLLGNVFVGRTTHTTKAISYGDLSGSIRILPAVADDAPAPIQAHLTGDQKSFRPWTIKVGVNIDEEFITRPMPGIVGYDGQFTNPDDQLQDKIALEMLRIERSMQRTEESYAAQMLATGTVTVDDETGTERYTISVGYTTGSAATDQIQPALTGNYPWNNSLGDPMATLEELDDQIRQNSTWDGPLQIICGSNIAAAVRANTKVKDMLDNRRMNYGQLTQSQMNNYIGTLGGYDFFKYSMVSKNQLTGTTTHWNANTIAMVPVGDPNIGIHYGAIAAREGDDPKGKIKLIQTDRWVHMSRSDDPVQDKMIFQTSPVPLILDPTPIRIKVVVVP